MDVIVCWDGDKIGRRVGRAVLADDVGEVRRVDQAINAGNDLWRSFALRVGGSIVEIGGDEGRVQVPASSLSDVADIARQYAQTVGATVSVGIAMKLSEAAKALLVAKLRGGNQITIWDPDMQAEIDEVNAHPQAEKDKLSEEYLGKGQPGVAGAEGHTGMTGSSRGSKVKGTQGDHEEGAVSSQLFDDAPDAPESTHAAADFEDELHAEASKQDQKDQQDAQQQESHLGEVKQRLVQALQVVRQSMPQIQQISQTAPEVYASLMALTQGLVDLGREVVGKPEPAPQDPNATPDVAKTEDLAKTVSDIQPVARHIEGPGRLSFDYSNHLPPAAKSKGLTLKVTHVAGPTAKEHLVTDLMHEGRRVGTVTGYVHHGDAAIEPHSDLLEEFRGQGLGQAMYEAMYAHAKNKLGLKSVSGGSHSADAHRLHTRLSQKHGFAYRADPIVKPEDIRAGFTNKPYSYALKGEMEPEINEDEIIGQGKGVIFHHEDLSGGDPLDKAALGAQGGAQAGRQHLELPAGSVMDGKVKVQHADGTKGWKHVQAGMIAGQEADAPVIGMNTHPVSSRSPGSK